MRKLKRAIYSTGKQGWPEWCGACCVAMLVGRSLLAIRLSGQAGSGRGAVSVLSCGFAHDPYPENLVTCQKMKLWNPLSA